MAFTIYNWSCVSSSLNQGLVNAAIATPSSDTTTEQGSMNLFSYYSLDALATINATDYFVPVVEDLRLWDVIIITGSDGSEMMMVSAITQPDDNGLNASVTIESFSANGSVGTANIINGAVTGPKLAYPLNGVATGFEFDTTTSSATPGTIRSLLGKMSVTATTMTSGNLVGTRGEVDYVGASGGFVYGVQGKLIPAGTISGSSWNAGLFGQLDISGAIVNAGQMAPIWGDYGAASGTLTDQTGLYGIAMTNTTAAVLEGQIYLYGGAQNLLLLNTNSGLSGTTYFLNAGTGANSAGSATYAAGTKVIRISIDGTNYYLKAFTSNA